VDQCESRIRAGVALDLRAADLTRQERKQYEGKSMTKIDVLWRTRNKGLPPRPVKLQAGWAGHDLKTAG
jgi:hypothetical protein